MLRKAVSPGLKVGLHTGSSMGRFRIILLCLMLVSCSCSASAARYGMKVLASEQRNGYECRLIEYKTGKSERIRAYLLVPDSFRVDRKLPAVVMLHDHGARFDIGKEKLVKPLGAPEYIEKSSREWVDKYFDGVYLADRMASGGYVVLVADALYWGDRSSGKAREWSRLSFSVLPEAAPGDRDSLKAEIKRLKGEVYEGQRSVYDSLAAEGVVWAEKILHDDMVSVELLASLPYVDSGRIGAFGFSMGAHRCWLLSAFSDRVKCGAAVCWMTSLEVYDQDNASDLSMRIPSMRSEMDFPDIARLLRPKPMIFMSGKQDHLFPESAVNEAFSKMHAIYGDTSGPEPSALRTVFFDGGHHCGKEVQATVADFFRAEL